MSNLPIEGKHDDQSISLSFTRKQFSEFVFKHIQTPSEEVRKVKMGFDLTKQRLKSIVDKIDYYIEKNNRLMNRDFSSTISVDDSRTMKRGSYDDFFNIDGFESSFLVEVSITLSYLIDFGLENGHAAPEKQVVVIRFNTMSPAEIVTEIRTTEFTWPASIFTLVQKELDDISAELRGTNPISQSAFFAPARLFSGKEGWTESNTFAERIFKFIASLALTVSIISFAVGFGGVVGRSDTVSSDLPVVFDQITKNFVPVNPVEYLNHSDWQERLSRVRDSEELRSFIQGSEVGSDSVEGPLTSAINFLTSLPIWLYAMFSIISVAAWLNIREIARIKENRIGRIWLSSRMMPQRSGITRSEGILGSLVFGLCGSALFGLIVAGLKSFTV